MLFSYNTCIYDSLDMAIKDIAGDHSEIISKKMFSVGISTIPSRFSYRLAKYYS